ncbi:MAG TPA: translocation/assembly module TamB domain-containing protein, partial [Vicinamibacteria bacterium]|nr:translocation/assembly module TamB domain-containing protein [Vicinamibacteria bacterium]
MRPSRRAAVLVVLVAAAVLGALALGWFPQGPLRGLLESRLRALVGPDSRIGGVRVVPGRLSVELRGLVLDAPTYRLEADRVHVTLSRDTLFRDGLFVDRLEMHGGHVVVRTPSEPVPPAPPPSGPLVIRDVAIGGVTFSYEDPALGGPLVLRSLDVSGSVGEGVLAAQASGGVWQRADPIALGPLRARLRISPRLELHLESLTAGLTRTRVEAAGALGRVGDLRPDLRFEARADLAELGPLAGLSPASGMVQAHGRAWGTADAINVEAELDGRRLQASGWTLDRVRAELTHATGTARTSVTARLSLLGGDGTLEARLSGSDLRGTLEASGVDLRRLAAQLGGGGAGLRGAASGAVRFEGDVRRRLRIEAEAEASGQDGGGMRFAARARARGPVRLPGPDLDLAWTASLDTEPASGAALPPGRLTAAGTARGALPPAVDGTVDGTLSLPGAAGPVPVRIEGTLRSQADRVRAEVRLEAAGGTVEGSAETAGTRVRALELAGRGVDLARLVAGARGVAAFAWRSSGPLDALSGGGHAAVESLGWRGLELGALRVDVEAERGAARLRAALPRLGATADARTALGKDASLRGRIDVAGAPLEALAPLLPEGRPLAGTLTGSATFDVPLADPGAASAEGRIETLEMESGALTAHTVAPFTAGFAEGRVTVGGLHLRGTGLSAQVSGSAGAAPGAPLALRATVEADLGALPVTPRDWTLGGTARAEVTVDGTRAAPRAHGFLSLEDVALDSPAAPPVRVDEGRLALEGDAIRIPGLTVAVAGGTIEVEGEVPIAAFWREARRQKERPAPGEEARLGLTWSGVQAGEILRRLAPAQETAVEATLAGRAELRGGLGSLGELRGTLSVPATTARVQDLPLELSPGEVRLDAGRLTLETLELRTAGGSLRLAGTVDLPRRTLDVTGQGTLELRALSPFLEEAALTGTSRVDLRVGGTLDEPRPEGTVRVEGGTLRLRTLPQALTGLAAEAVLDGRTLRLTRATAELGGGELSASGSARIEGTGLADARFELAGRGLALRYPEGMRSRLEADLTLTGRTGALALSGTVRALRGLYDLDTALEESLTAPAPASAESALLRSVALDIRVVTESPILVRNSLARLQATGRLTVRGDMQNPAPIGTLDIESGGKVFVQGQEFVIGSGRLVYSGNWDPVISLDATARIPDFDRQAGAKRADVNVTVELQGPLAGPRLSLRSDPAYSKLEIVNLIATGDSQNPSARVAMAGPAATLLAGRLTETIGGGLGLDEVRIQPELVAREGEVETGARFTFGKRLSQRVNLVYSLSLQDPEGRFIQVEVSPGRDVALTVRRTDDGSFTFGAGQRLRFGGTRPPAAAAEQRVRVVEVRLEGDRPLEPGALRAILRTAPGDRKTVWDLQDDADRLRERLVERGYLESEVGGRFDGQVAVFAIRAGERYRWRVEGLSDPPDLTGVIHTSLFEEEALDRGRARLLAELRRRGHLRATVDARAVADEGRTLVFEVEPGPVLRAQVSFPGASALSPSRLLEAAGGAGRLLSDPEAAVRDVVAAYHAAWHLGAEVDPPRVSEEAGGRVSIAVPVREGPRARLTAVRFEGATRDAAELARVAGLETGAAYEPGPAVAAADRLRGHYFGLGHASVRVSPRLDTRDTDVEVVFEIAEGEKVTVAGVALVGLRHARESLVRRHVPIRPGDPLDPRQVAELERRLLDLGLFTRAAATVSEDNPATVTVTLEEGDRVRAGYLASYNDDKGSRGELDGELRNLLGAGISAGARLSAGPDLRDARGFLTAPALLLPTGRLTASVFRLEEDLPLLPGEDGGPTFSRVQTGGQIQSTRPFGDRWNLLFGYRLKTVAVDSEFLTSSHRVAGLDVSLLRDTRDNPLDARRGRFLSLSLEVSPRALGSDFDFVKGFAQAFISRPLSESLTWAQGYRLGLAHVLDDEPLVADEGFEAGGANSIRGF